MQSESAPPPGGFVPPAAGLLSPTPSTASSPAAASLPAPRRTPLRPGGNREDQVRRDLEEALLSISRRYVKKFSGPDPAGPIVGFTTFSEVAAALSQVVDTLWRSGTPILQIPFLLRICGDFTQFVRSFPPAPTATFQLLGKLDHCFASLLCGKDIVTQETLPGFENGLRGGMTMTDMVRCRSLVEQTRVLIVEIMSSDESDDDDEDYDAGYGEDDDDDDDDDMNDLDADDDEDGPLASVHLDAARVFENTIIQLNNRLGDGGLAST
ncbi:meiotic recombination DMC1 [Cordyceps militaris]|uniref:Meiotic recombination DMC1 n=1 Tax=Cordyceps militaris TaxID=73501 RepID=A0A2H4SHV2_CORMI|nr:meiotic recombination DMC1 [Cordyceps militaris]